MSADPNEKAEPESSQRRPILLGILVLVVIAGCAVGGYAIGKSGGEDLSAARAAGEAEGTKVGARKGAAKGYLDGFKKGQKAGYEKFYGDAYEEAYRKAFQEAGLAAPRKVSVPDS